MEDLMITGDFKSPTLKFSASNKMLEISGRSWPENSIMVYEPAMDWIDKYFGSNDEAKVVFKLEYFNTSTSKIILDLIKKLESYHIAGKKIDVEWFYETDDDDAFDDGEVIKSLSTLPFEIKGIEEFEIKFV